MSDALTVSAIKSYVPAQLGLSGDPKADFKRADELDVDKALALDPDDAVAHDLKGSILSSQARVDEAIAEYERALALDPIRRGRRCEAWARIYLASAIRQKP